MPRLDKGGKWVFGWVIVDADRRIRVPQDAWTEYGFKAGDEALLLNGSKTSGGFGLTSEDGTLVVQVTSEVPIYDVVEAVDAARGTTERPLYTDVIVSPVPVQAR